MSDIVFKAKVITGMNKAEGILKDNVENIAVATGMDIFPGTLNLKLSKPLCFNVQKINLNWVHGQLVPCKINGHDSFINIGKGKIFKNPYIVRVMSNIHFRKTFNLKDNSQVNLSISEDHILKISPTKNIFYYLKYKMCKF